MRVISDLQSPDNPQAPTVPSPNRNCRYETTVGTLQAGHLFPIFVSVAVNPFRRRLSLPVCPGIVVPFEYEPYGANPVSIGISVGRPFQSLGANPTCYVRTQLFLQLI